MKPPRPTEGVAKHCWGRRRRAAKKIEKGIWKVMSRLGILKRVKISASDCAWEEEYELRRRRSRRSTPYIAGFERDYWGECDTYNITTHAHNHLEMRFRIWDEINEETGWPTKSAFRDDRHALQLLLHEIRSRKRRAPQPKEGT